MLNPLIDVLDKFVAPADAGTRWDIASEAAQSFGIKSILVAKAHATTRELAWINTTMSDSWMEEYLYEDYVQVDTLVSDLADRSGTSILESGSLEAEHARSRQEWRYNHGLRQAGYGTLISSRFSAGEEFGLFVTLGFEDNLGQRVHQQDVDLRLFSAILATQVASPLPDRVNQLLTGAALQLTPRQKDVLCLLANGYQTARIAERLGISEATVTFHMAKAREALGAQTREQALAIALQYQLIAP